MVSRLAQTDDTAKVRYQKQLDTYKKQFMTYHDNKASESNQQSGFRISMDSETGFKLDLGRDDARIHFSDRPQFIHPTEGFITLLKQSAISVTLLLVYMIGIFGFGYLVFLKKPI